MATNIENVQVIILTNQLNDTFQNTHTEPYTHIYDVFISIYYYFTYIYGFLV